MATVVLACASIVAEVDLPCLFLLFCVILFDKRVTKDLGGHMMSTHLQLYRNEAHISVTIQEAVK